MTATSPAALPEASNPRHSPAHPSLASPRRLWSSGGRRSSLINCGQKHQLSVTSAIGASGRSGNGAQDPPKPPEPASGVRTGLAGPSLTRGGRPSGPSCARDDVLALLRRRFLVLKSVGTALPAASLLRASRAARGACMARSVPCDCSRKLVPVLCGSLFLLIRGSPRALHGPLKVVRTQCLTTERNRRRANPSLETKIVMWHGVSVAFLL